MSTLVLATHNKGKIAEFSEMLKPYFASFQSAAELQLPEPEETEETFAGNALIKARAAHEATGHAALSDDSGLCVNALDGQPGIYSARWAGPEKNFETAMNFLDTKLAGISDRSAYFISVLAYVAEDGSEHIFDGRINGNLVWPPSGANGFGYDPMFVPENERKTFGEMEPHEKKQHSHRARAFAKFIDFLQNQSG